MFKNIQNNPYRFLGICSNAPATERLANFRKAKAFLKVDKDINFPFDLDCLLPPMKRSTEQMDYANNSINLPKDMLRYALFWFVNDSPIDTIALDYLQRGDTFKASELFRKKQTFSSLINQSVLSFINGDNGNAIECVTTVIHDNNYRIAFVESICGSSFQISENELAQLFIDALLEDIKVVQLKDLFEQSGISSEDDEYLRQKAIEGPIASINDAVSNAKKIKKDDANAQYQAGVSLMNSSKSNLQFIRSILGLSNMQYQLIADNLAKQILQCGINYYNNSNEDKETEIDKAFSLQNYALSIAVGKLTKDRCKENVDILNRMKDELPPKTVRYYDTKIKDALNVYRTQPDEISYAIELIKKVVPYLMSIKEVLGNSNTYYLRISTLIVNASLHNIIEEFNSVMTDDLHLRLFLDSTTIHKVTNVFEQAWKATLYMDKLDMEADFKNGRYNQNRSVLKEQVEQVINLQQIVSLDMRGETKMFSECRSVSDYRHFLDIFPDGKYASQVKIKIEKLEFDACKTTQDCDSFKKKYPNTLYNISSKWEDCYFNNCRTIVQFKLYLKDYPSGKYVDRAKDRIDDLSYSSCKTLSDFYAYIRDFPRGRYVAAAKVNVDNLSFDACYLVYQYQNYLNHFPNGRHRHEAQQIINDEEMWERCMSGNSKELYKQYLSQFPNGRHKTEAEKKANACYIATMVYGDYNHPKVIALRRFRDDQLQNSKLGRSFISFYYKHSPSWVEKLQNKKTFNFLIKSILDVFIKLYNYEGK